MCTARQQNEDPHIKHADTAQFGGLRKMTVADQTAAYVAIAKASLGVSVLPIVIYSLTVAQSAINATTQPSLRGGVCNPDD